MDNLLDIIDEYYNLEELRSLCFKLQVDYDNIGGEGKRGKARELVDYMRRYGRTEELIETIKEERPNLPWPEPTPSEPEIYAVKTAVWNALHKSLWSKRTFLNQHKTQRPLIEKFSYTLWIEVLQKPVDDRPEEPKQILEEIKNSFFSCNEPEFYDYLTFILNYWNDLRHYDPKHINHTVNKALRQSGSGKQYVPEHQYSRFTSGSIQFDDPDNPIH